MTENQNQQHRPFCTAPFFHYYYKGDKSNTKMLPCCESRVDGKTEQTFNDYWNGDFLKEVRQAMLEGKKHDICTRCIDVESKGSFRALSSPKGICAGRSNCGDGRTFLGRARPAYFLSGDH